MMKSKSYKIFGDDLLAISGILFFSSKFHFFNIPITHIIIFFLFIISLFKFMLVGRINNRLCLYFIFSLYLICSNILYYDFILYKKLIGFILYSSAYLLYFYNNKNRVFNILKIYYLFSLIICVICIIQEVGYLTGVSYLYDFDIYGFHSRATPSGQFLRVYGFFSEPASLANILLIPLCYTFYSIILGKNLVGLVGAVIIIATALLTFSIIPYMLITFFIIYFSYFKYRRAFVFIVPAVISLVIIGIYTSDNLSEKVGTLFFDKHQLVTGAGASTYAIVSNFLVNTSAFINNPVIGSGFSSYENNYYTYIFNFFNIDDATAILRIKYDAIMYFNLLGEMGLVGVFFLFFIFKRKNKNNLFVNALLYGLVICLIRNGSYFSTINFYNMGFLIILMDCRRLSLMNDYLKVK